MNTVDRHGSNGGALITAATGAVTGLKATKVTCVEDTVFSVLQNDLYPTGAGIGQALTSRSWKRGDEILGLTRAITVTSGAVLTENEV